MQMSQHQVMAFHKAFGLPAPEAPILTPQEAAFRLKLLSEELAEAHEALLAFSLGDPVPLVDLLCDLKYFLDGTAVALGIDLEPFFNAVHQNNMAKLCKNCGKPHYRADGKVAKPDGYEQVDLYKVWVDKYGNL